jgi:hypothetical protein
MSCAPSGAPARAAVLFFLLALSTNTALAQPAQFNVDDVLDLPSATMSALSRDGHWLVVTTAALRDRVGTDNHRFGDPTYSAPSVADIAVVDTRTGAARRVFTDKRQARAFEWSPDAAPRVPAAGRRGVPACRLGASQRTRAHAATAPGRERR